MKKSLLLALFSLFAVIYPFRGNAAAGLGYAGQNIGQSEQFQKGPKLAPSGNHPRLTGSIDEQAGQDVPTEAIEKYLGQKVTVRGIASTNGTGPVFQVRTVNTTSETGAPKPAEQDKKIVHI